MIKEKYIYIKEIFLNHYKWAELSYKHYFILNNVYEFEYIKEDFFSHYQNNNEYIFSKNELNDFFIPLDKWRELQINKILENE